VAAIARGEEKALAELVRRYQGRVVNLAKHYLDDREEADNATQDTFVKIWEHAGSYRGSAQVWTWIYRIALNICSNIKQHMKIPTDELDESVLASDFQQPDIAYRRKEQERIIRRALDALSDDQRMALVLTRYEQLSYVDAAQVMGKPVKAFAMVLLRAKDNMRVRLTPFLLRGKLSP
jgi:RNA polymerase sigma-70 factor (ECF subfamily)